MLAGGSLDLRTVEVEAIGTIRAMQCVTWPTHLECQFPLLIILTLSSCYWESSAQLENLCCSAMRNEL